MNDKLLAMAATQADGASVLRVTTRSQSVTLFNFGLAETLARDHDELDLRLIKGGRLGQAVASSTADPQAVLRSALASAANGPAVSFTFPGADLKGDGGGRIYDPELADLPLTRLVDDAKCLADGLKRRDPEMLVNVYLESGIKHVEVRNTSGLEREYDQTFHKVWLFHMFDVSKEGLTRGHDSCRYFRVGDDVLDTIVRDRKELNRTVAVPTRKMPVMFLGYATWYVMYRVYAGTEGSNVVKGVSPLRDKLGTKVLGDAITIWDDPTMDWAPGSVPFDDEGMPTRKRPIVEQGVLRNFCFDLNWGSRSGRGSTAGGYHHTMWTQGLEDPISPRFSNFVVTPGTQHPDEIVRTMEEGIVIHEVIGFHSGNILAGEYNMGVGTGTYVKDGKVVGRCQDTMVAGNIYEDFNRVKAIGNDMELTPMGYMPSILVDGVSVSGGK